MIPNTARTGQSYRHCEQRSDETVNPDQDRLSNAKNFAAELSESRLREMAEAYRKRWTPEKRAEKAKRIQIIKPWTKAAGPKFGPHAKGAGFKKRAFVSALRQQNWFLRSLRAESGQWKSAMAMGITSSAALYLLMAVEGAEIWMFPRVTERNNE